MRILRRLCSVVSGANDDGESEKDVGGMGEVSGDVDEGAPTEQAVRGLLTALVTLVRGRRRMN